jgi:hypothetical protein
MVRYAPDLRRTPALVHSSGYNEQRLHSAIGYVTPKAMLEGRQKQIHAERDHKLEAARRQRERAARSKHTAQVEPQSDR